MQIWLLRNPSRKFVSPLFFYVFILERNSGDDKQPQYYDPYKWPPPGRPPSNDLPDLYTLFRKIHIAEFDKKVFGKNSTDAEDKNKSESKSSVESDQQYHRHHHVFHAMSFLTDKKKTFFIFLLDICTTNHCQYWKSWNSTKIFCQH